MNNQQEQIDEICNSLFDGFDFETVHKLMTILNYTWREFNSIKPSIPHIPYIKGYIESLVSQLLNDPERDSIHSNGFTVSRVINSDKFSLCFSAHKEIRSKIAY
jgi:hypothetical protein